MKGLPSFHDDFLVSYEVDCENRRIRLHTRVDPRERAKRGQRPRTFIFNGVEGYQFENDAFGNIIFALEAVSIEQLFAEYGARIAESSRLAGAPGPWAGDIAAAPHSLKAKGVQAFRVSSSYGLSGWILAKEVFVEQA